MSLIFNHTFLDVLFYEESLAQILIANLKVATQIHIIIQFIFFLTGFFFFLFFCAGSQRSQERNNSTINVKCVLWQNVFKTQRTLICNSRNKWLEVLVYIIILNYDIFKNHNRSRKWILLSKDVIAKILHSLQNNSNELRI